MLAIVSAARVLKNNMTHLYTIFRWNGARFTHEEYLRSVTEFWILRRTTTRAVFWSIPLVPRVRRRRDRMGTDLTEKLEE